MSVFFYGILYQRMQGQKNASSPGGILKAGYNETEAV